MKKEDLYVLINEMNDDTPYSCSSESISWKALRRAEKLNDKALYPILKEIILENEHKRDVCKRQIRDRAYFIGGKLLANAFDYEFCEFYIDRLNCETSKYVLSSMLDCLAEFDVPQSPNIDLIVECTQNEKWQIRFSAIQALGSFDTNKSRECLRTFVNLDDEKRYDYEIVYAQAALGRIGKKEDIKLLQKHANSRKVDMKISTRFAIERIENREV